jgi:hypothetical protein
MSLLAAFFAGLISAPLIGWVFRPLLKQVVKGGIIVTDAVKRNTEDAVQSARAEINKTRAEIHAERAVRPVKH